MVSTTNSTPVAVAATSLIPWQNGSYTPCDRANSGSTVLTLGRPGLYSIDFDASVQTAAANPAIVIRLVVNNAPTGVLDTVATTAATSPVHTGLNTVIRVNQVPTTIGISTNSAITVNSAQMKAIRL